MKDALECKGAITQSAALIDILSRYGCRSMPKTSDELLRQVIGICCYNFRDKPLAAMRAIREGIPGPKRSFWSSHSVEDLHDLYTPLCATPQRVALMSLKILM